MLTIPKVSLVLTILLASFFQMSFFPSISGNSQEDSLTQEYGTNNFNSFSSLKEDTKNVVTQTTGNYEWIWDELQGADGYLDGDDPMIWGGNLGPYHNYTELTNKLQSLNTTFPDLVDMFSIGKSYQGREIWVVRLTQENQTTAKTEFFLVAHHHGREAITIENALFIIDRIIYFATQGSLENKTWALSLLMKKEIYVLPSLNPDSLSVLPWFPWIRKNLRPVDEDGDGTTEDETEFSDIDGDNYLGSLSPDFWNLECVDGPDLDTLCGNDLPGGVDLNRNYGEHWRDQSIEPWTQFPQTEVYAGTVAFSEPETQAIRKFVYGHDFNFALSLHSGVKSTIAPWGYTLDPPPNSKEIYAIRDKLVIITGFPDWWDWGGGYFVTGEWGDWMYATKGIKAFTLETYGNHSSLRIISFEGTNESQEIGIWDKFNPDGDEILETSEPVWEGAIYLLSEPHMTLSNSLPNVIIQEESILSGYIIDNLDSLQVTINWTTFDPDGDEVSSNVYLSEFTQQNWTLIAKNTSKTSIELNRLFLKPNIEYFVKISVTDGKDYVFDMTTHSFRVELLTLPGLTSTTTTTSTIPTTTPAFEVWLVLSTVILLLQGRFRGKKRENFDS